jgi:hypothetical protein
MVLRNPDGSVYGGLVKVSIGVGMLWFAIGFGLTYGLTTLVKTILKAYFSCDLGWITLSQVVFNRPMSSQLWTQILRPSRAI